MRVFLAGVCPKLMFVAKILVVSHFHFTLCDSSEHSALLNIIINSFNTFFVLSVLSNSLTQIFYFSCHYFLKLTTYPPWVVEVLSDLYVLPYLAP